MTDQRPSPESMALKLLKEWGERGWLTRMDFHAEVQVLHPELTLALTRAYQDGERAGMELAAKIADGWAHSKSCVSHDDDPCCHVRTGYGIAQAIRAAIPATGEETP